MTVTDRPGGRGTILFGGSGFLGSCILENYPDVVSVGRRRPPTTNRHIPIESLENLDALRDVEFDNVIYIVGNSDRSTMDKEHIPRGETTAFDYHVLPLFQAMEQLKHYPIKKLIHFSTVLIYDPERITLPVSEHSPINPYRSRYVLSHYLAEEACKYYANSVPIINVRLSNVYGPTMAPRFDVISNLVCQLLNEGKAQVRSTKPERDFIFIEDAADAIVKLIESEYIGTLNLGTGTMHSIRTVVSILQDMTGCPIVDLDGPTDSLLRFRCDMRTLCETISWCPQYSLEEGIAKTYTLMKEWNRS